MYKQISFESSKSQKDISKYNACIESLVINHKMRANNYLDKTFIQKVLLNTN